MAKNKIFTGMSKIAIAAVLASTLGSTPGTALAAEHDIRNKDGQNLGSINEILLSNKPELFKLIKNLPLYTYETNKNLYKANEIDALYKEGATTETIGKAAEKLESQGEAPVEITVNSVEAVSKTEIKVTFSNGEVKNFTVDPLTNGTNTVKFEYNNQKFSVEVNFTEVSKAAVSDIKFHNYRHVSVEFNTKVDAKTAADPANYYFEIVDGDVADDTFGENALGTTNQLSKIETATTLADGWWDKAHGNITATEVNGKTVVDIKLPEDARFTNTVDTEGVIDAEQTLHATLADGSKKALIKNTNVLVGVRNVRAFSGDRNIDTFVKSIKILDEQGPSLVKAIKDDGTTKTGIDLKKSVDLKSDGSEKVVLEYDEPVFDAHGLESSTERDVKVYINGKLAANTKSGDLAGILDFEMGANKAYDAAKFATLNVKAAATAASEDYLAGKILNVKIVGVTDLAGNIQVPSTTEFNVKVVDPTVGDPSVDPLQKPEPKEIVQVADNMFRVTWNVENATGQFIIENADGEGGTLKVNTTVSKADPKIGKDFYSYAEVQAYDVDPADDPLVEDDDILAYDGQDFINREVRINKPFVVDGGKYTVAGNNKSFGLMKISKDINAPVVIQPKVDLDYNDTNKKIILDVADIVPEGVSQDYAHKVLALKYAHNGTDFDRNTVDATGDFLPIRVSYKTSTGALRSQLLTNLDVPGSSYGGSGTITGVAGSIHYDVATKKLTLDLSGYASLLDKDSALVGGVEYKIELPKGFFADSEKDSTLTASGELFATKFTGTLPGEDLAIVAVGGAATLGDGNGDILYVSNARNADYGYTSNAHTVTQKVKAKPETEDEKEADTVPQTSKSLIKFDSSKNEVTVEFKGSIDVSTLKNPANYKLDGKTLKDWGVTSSDIEYLQDFDGSDIVAQYAIFKVPTDAVSADGDVELRVSGVANKAGAKMTEVVTDVSLLDTKRAVALDAVVAGQRQIILTFDEGLSLREGQSAIAAAKNFKVKAGDTPLTVLEATVADRVVTLNLGSDIPSTGEIVVEIVKDASGNILIIDKSQNKNPLNNDNPYKVRRN